MSTRMLWLVVSVLFFCLPLSARNGLTLSEASGDGDLVVRVTGVNRAGQSLGSGRVIVLDALESRIVHPAEVLSREELRGELRVEVIGGNGRLEVSGTSSSRRRSVRHPGMRPTSSALIDDALASGAIDGETAILYRSWALFGDARLPAQYQGNDSAISDSLYMSEVRDRFAALSEATQTAVQPFLTPPAYQGSWAIASHTGTPSAAATPPPCQLFSDDWGWINTANGYVRVWYRLDLPDAGRARALADRIDALIWPKISALMSRLPVSDVGHDCDGSTGRYDIYLSDVPRSLTIAMKACDRAPRPVFTLLKRSSFDALAAHEIFHAFQFAYPLAGCIVDDDYRWWAESSAQWAQDYVLPADQGEQSAAPAFLGGPEKPLDFKNEGHEYGAYLLPFYVHRKTANAAFVNQAWENASGQPALEALDSAIAGGFDKVWPEFAADNWNRDPVNDYEKWDDLKAGATPPGNATARMVAAPDLALNLNVDLPRLSATYKHFEFDDSVSSVAFWNGVTSKLSLEQRFTHTVQYWTDPAADEQKRGAHITALIRIGGSWKTEDWTDRPVVTYCRDLRAERLEELVLIISNSEFKERGRKLQPSGLAPVLFVSNIGCWQWKGTANLTTTGPYSQMTLASTVTWTKAEQSGIPFTNYNATGTTNWSIEYRPPPPQRSCVQSGVMTVSDFFILSTANLVPLQGSYHRSYSAAGQETRPVPACEGAAYFPPWLMTPPPPIVPGIPGARFVTVSSDGRTMDGTYRPTDDANVSYTWHFVAQRE